METITTSNTLTTEKNETKSIYIKSGTSMPSVRFLIEKNLLFIQGESLSPEVEFLYKNVLLMVQTHLSTDKTFSLHLQMKNMNCMTVKYIIQLFQLLNSIGAPTSIVWYVDWRDTQMVEIIQDLSELVEVQISIHQL